ncbi:MAG: hypothetical protein KGM24_10865 [Elusimicrobia bacterium]|nr:hypothetical protein [Elusimicrobiota bacterium]
MTEKALKEQAAERPELPGWLSWTILALIACSIAFAYFLYAGPSFVAAASLREAFAPLVTVLDRRWYFDDVFYALAALGDRVAALAFWIDANVVDRVFVDGWGWLTLLLAELGRLFDDGFVDAAVDGFGGLSWDLGGALRTLVRDGQAQEYLLYAAIAFSLAAAMILTR